MRLLLKFEVLGLLLAFGLIFAPAQAQQLAKRLILKDGSYQPVTKWEVKGNRVRYYSAERFEWEEVPYSMVDWAATEKYENERRAGVPSPSVRAVDAEEEAERKREEERTPQVAPGLRLPATGGVFLVDYYRDQPQLIELMQNGTEIKKNTASNILRATINPLASNKQTVEMKDLHARIQAHVPNPAIYANIDQDQDPSTGPAPQQGGRYRIVRVQQKKDTRVVGNIKRPLLGKVKQQADVVETTSEPVSGGWVRVTPAVPLAPGEYALVEMLGEDMNLYVWDFGVNPTAPENPGVWKPVPTQENRTGTSSSPVLQGRPR